MTPTEVLLHRLSADQGDLESSLNGGKPAGPVERVEMGLSDPHDGGRTVALVTFERGLRIIYKPRPVELECAFDAMVDWWNRRGGGIELRTVRALPRRDYGWAEFIDAAPCLDETAAGRYYERAGVLICLAWLLDATDLHHGNLIAHGEHPVMVDLETLLHPRWPGERRSLLDTGLVPRWIRGPDGALYDVSGFGATTTNGSLGRKVPRQRNVVQSPDGEAFTPARFKTRVLSGFRQAAEVVISSREELLSPSGPMSRFSGQRVRVILRHSLAYRSALAAPESISSDSMLRPMRERAALEAITLVEQQALSRGDIPRFTAMTDSADWTVDEGTTIRGCFTRPSEELLVKRMRGLRAEKVEEQVRLLATALDFWNLHDLVMPREGSGDGRDSKSVTPTVEQPQERKVKNRGTREQKQSKVS